jgi:hypothetical protein
MMVKGEVAGRRNLPRLADDARTTPPRLNSAYLWCKACHLIKPDPAEMAFRYGAERFVLDWCERLVTAR